MCGAGQVLYLVSDLSQPLRLVLHTCELEHLVFIYLFFKFGDSVLRNTQANLELVVFQEDDLTF